ncbi:MAG: enoyl-CoA hydratase/isomerase family protein [Chloroflexi bacterium]|nr:enoyl-CoA hydratase/isomerase family protein [Chloroflexota bacterium]
MADIVLYEKRDHIAHVTLNRPENLNAINRAMSARLAEAWREMDTDPDVWVGIVTGAGRAFSAGADLKEMGGHDRPRGLEGFRPWRPSNVTQGLECSKPLIAAINGYCLAGALEVALSCDLRIASEKAQLGTPEVKWNVLHAYGALKLSRFIPAAPALQMLLTGEFISAQDALRIGLVGQVVPHEELMPTVERVAKRISENGQLAVRATKDLFYRGMSMSWEEALRYHVMVANIVYTSEDAKEGPQAFAEKRTPEFKGR